MKTQIRQMQPMSRLVLYWAVHYEGWSGSVPHNLINMAVDNVKRVTEARILEQIIQELRGMCPGMPADRSLLVPGTYELWSGDKLRAAKRLF